MKRGWITWDPVGLPATAFETRLNTVRQMLADRGLPALIVYSDVCRSNHARFLVNFMPYWNRALLIVPVERPPILICSLSPRVYPWIQSTTFVQDIRPGPDVARRLLAIAAEEKWQKIAVLDLPRVPQDIFATIAAAPTGLVDVPSNSIYRPALDPWELSMRRRAVGMAREFLTEELPTAIGIRDSELVASLEKKFRKAGAEDLVVLVSDGNGPPAPPKSTILDEHYSIMLALEYRGHWVRLSRPQASVPLAASIQNHFESLLKNWPASADGNVYIENLATSYPYESCEASQITPESIFALHLKSTLDGHTLYYGDTCVHADTGLALL